jgi:hypothetical protein
MNNIRLTKLQQNIENILCNLFNDGATCLIVETEVLTITLKYTKTVTASFDKEYFFSRYRSKVLELIQMLVVAEIQEEISSL